MANLITKMTAHMIEDRGDKKGFPCNTYATEAAAEKAAKKAATEVSVNLDRAKGEVDYLVFHVAAFDRWVAVIFMSEVLRRPTAMGGYLGVAPGFYKI